MKTPTKKIEYPKLGKIGGFKNVILKMLGKILITLLISTLVGGLCGYTVQNSFRNLIGINKTEEVVIETQEDEPIQEYVGDNTLVKFTTSLERFTEDLKNSDILKKVNEASVNVLLKTFQPVLDIINKLIAFLEKATFWVPFILIFLLTAWLSNKAFTISGKRYLTNGMDPQVIKNIETLEAKIKELVDHANMNLAKDTKK